MTNNNIKYNDISSPTGLGSQTVQGSWGSSKGFISNRVYQPTQYVPEQTSSYTIHKGFASRALALETVGIIDMESSGFKNTSSNVFMLSDFTKDDSSMHGEDYVKTGISTYIKRSDMQALKSTTLAPNGFNPIIDNFYISQKKAMFNYNINRQYWSVNVDQGGNALPSNVNDPKGLNNLFKYNIDQTFYISYAMRNTELNRSYAMYYDPNNQNIANNLYSVYNSSLSIQTELYRSKGKGFGTAMDNMAAVNLSTVNFSSTDQELISNAMISGDNSFVSFLTNPACASLQNAFRFGLGGAQNKASGELDYMVMYNAHQSGMQFVRNIGQDLGQTFGGSTARDIVTLSGGDGRMPFMEGAHFDVSQSLVATRAQTKLNKRQIAHGFFVEPMVRTRIEENRVITGLNEEDTSVLKSSYDENMKFSPAGNNPNNAMKGISDSGLGSNIFGSDSRVLTTNDQKVNSEILLHLLQGNVMEAFKVHDYNPYADGGLHGVGAKGLVVNSPMILESLDSTTTGCTIKLGTLCNTSDPSTTLMNNMISTINRQTFTNIFNNGTGQRSAMTPDKGYINLFWGSVARQGATPAAPDVRGGADLTAVTQRVAVGPSTVAFVLPMMTFNFDSATGLSTTSTGAGMGQDYDAASLLTPVVPGSTPALATEIAKFTAIKNSSKFQGFIKALDNVCLLIDQSTFNASTGAATYLTASDGTYTLTVNNPVSMARIGTFGRGLRDDNGNTLNPFLTPAAAALQLQEQVYMTDDGCFTLITDPMAMNVSDVNKNSAVIPSHQTLVLDSLTAPFVKASTSNNLSRLQDFMNLAALGQIPQNNIPKNLLTGVMTQVDEDGFTIPIGVRLGSAWGISYNERIRNHVSAGTYESSYNNVSGCGTSLIVKMGSVAMDTYAGVTNSEVCMAGATSVMFDMLLVDDVTQPQSMAPTLPGATTTTMFTNFVHSYGTAIFGVQASLVTEFMPSRSVFTMMPNMQTYVIAVKAGSAIGLNNMPVSVNQVTGSHYKNSRVFHITDGADTSLQLDHINSTYKTNSDTVMFLPVSKALMTGVSSEVIYTGGFVAGTSAIACTASQTIAYSSANVALNPSTMISISWAAAARQMNRAGVMTSDYAYTTNFTAGPVATNQLTWDMMSSSLASTRTVLPRGHLFMPNLMSMADHQQLFSVLGTNHFNDACGISSMRSFGAEGLTMVSAQYKAGPVHYFKLRLTNDESVKDVILRGVKKIGETEINAETIKDLAVVVNPSMIDVAKKYNVTLEVDPITKKESISSGLAQPDFYFARSLVESEEQGIALAQGSYRHLKTNCGRFVSISLPPLKTFGFLDDAAHNDYLVHNQGDTSLIYQYIKNATDKGRRFYVTFKDGDSDNVFLLVKLKHLQQGELELCQGADSLSDAHIKIFDKIFPEVEANIPDTSGGLFIDGDQNMNYVNLSLADGQVVTVDQYTLLQNLGAETRTGLSYSFVRNIDHNTLLTTNFPTAFGTTPLAGAFMIAVFTTNSMILPETDENNRLGSPFSNLQMEISNNREFSSLAVQALALKVNMTDSMQDAWDLLSNDGIFGTQISYGSTPAIPSFELNQSIRWDKGDMAVTSFDNQGNPMGYKDYTFVPSEMLRKKTIAQHIVDKTGHCRLDYIFNTSFSWLLTQQNNTVPVDALFTNQKNAYTNPMEAIGPVFPYIKEVVTANVTMAPSFAPNNRNYPIGTTPAGSLTGTGTAPNIVYSWISQGVPTTTAISATTLMPSLRVNIFGAYLSNFVLQRSLIKGVKSPKNVPIVPVIVTQVPKGLFSKTTNAVSSKLGVYEDQNNVLQQTNLYRQRGRLKDSYAMPTAIESDYYVGNDYRITLNFLGTGASVITSVSDVNNNSMFSSIQASITVRLRNNASLVMTSINPKRISKSQNYGNFSSLSALASSLNKTILNYQDELSTHTKGSPEAERISNKILEATGQINDAIATEFRNLYYKDMITDGTETVFNHQGTYQQKEQVASTLGELRSNEVYKALYPGRLLEAELRNDEQLIVTHLQGLHNDEIVDAISFIKKELAKWKDVDSAFSDLSNKLSNVSYRAEAVILYKAITSDKMRRDLQQAIKLLLSEHKSSIVQFDYLLSIGNALQGYFKSNKALKRTELRNLVKQASNLVNVTNVARSQATIKAAQRTFDTSGIINSSAPKVKSLKGKDSKAESESDSVPEVGEGL